jgi:hypothetical protein
MNPTSDITTGGTVSGSSPTRYQAVDDYPDTTPTDYLQFGTTANSFATFAFPNFEIPTGSTSISVDVLYYDAEPANGTNSSAGRIRVNATNYDSATHNPSGTTYTSRTKSWATNPAGGSWTVAQVNNVGGTGLNGFGVIGPDSNPAWRSSSIQLRVNYTPPAGPPYYDEFNRANETPLSGGGSWIASAAGGSLVNLVSNAVISADGLWNAYAYRTEAYDANQRSKVKIASTVGAVSFGGPTVRSTDDASHNTWWNGYRATVLSTTGVRVTVIYGGASAIQETIGADFTGTFAQTDEIELSIVGSDLSVTQNGSPLGSRTDSNNRIPSGGAPGFYTNSSTDAATFDSWQGGNAAPATSIKTVLGVAKASVKMVDGLAIGSVKSIDGLQ